MAELEVPETDGLDYAGLCALLGRRVRSVQTYYAALRNALLRGHGGALSDRERSLISNMVHVLIDDIGKALNDARTNHNEEAPNGPLSQIVSGWGPSVYDRLAKAGFLGDLDLIRALTHRMAEHLVVLKSRQAMPALGSEPAEQNERGPFGEPAIDAHPVVAQAMSEYLVESSRRFDGYGNPRLPLHEMSSETRHRLLWACAAAWREEIGVGRLDDENELDDAIERTAVFALDAIDADAERFARAEALAGAVMESGGASASILKSVLNHGHVAVFEALLAGLLDLPFSLVHEMTFEPGGARLAIALRAAGADRQDVVAMGDRIVTPSGPAQDFPHLIDVFDACSHEDAKRIVRSWRRRPEYAAALRRIRGLADDGDNA